MLSWFYRSNSRTFNWKNSISPILCL